MHNTRWILLDTETTGFAAPIYTVELAAQRMRGWEPEGEPFRRLLNQNADIPPDASRVHGYTREILERDGAPALEVYRDFARYVDGLPLVAYNLEYDLDKVLLPEWARLGIAPIGRAGFCALRLAQRLLDPVPAGNCKLQTLRQFYRLPERGAHTGLGDVETVVDLCAAVLRPIAERRGLHTWDALVAYTQAEWYPSRLAFGKHKGRTVEDARTDAALRQWLEWLADSSSERSAKMGRWYLAQLDGVAVADKGDALLLEVAEASSAATGGAAVHTAGLVVFVHPEIQEMERLIAAARARLAALEADYTEEHHAVEITRRQLFEMLRTQYQQRDRFKLVIAYRRKYLDILMFEGEEEAEEATSEYEDAQAQSDAEYAQAEAGFAEQAELSEEDKAELKSLYRKLVRLYHPDRFENDEKRRETYHLLTSAINQARDNADIEVLREIAHDTEGFLMRQGWASLDFSEAAELASRRKLFDMLQLKIVTTLEAINTLKEDPAYTLHQMTLEQPGYLQTVAVDYAARLEAEIEQLKADAQELNAEIETLQGI